MTSDSQEALRKNIRETQIEYHQEVDNQFEKLPDFERIFQSSDQDLGKIVELLKSQVLIFKEDMIQKERAYRHMQERYQNILEVHSEEHKAIRDKIAALAQDKKADMQKKYLLERKIAYLEADVELGNGYVNAQKLAINAAKEINIKIQKADNTKSLTALNTKIQRRITAIKPI